MKPTNRKPTLKKEATNDRAHNPLNNPYLAYYHEDPKNMKSLRKALKKLEKRGNKNQQKNRVKNKQIYKPKIAF